MPGVRSSGGKYLAPYNYSHENLPDWLIYLALCILVFLVYVLMTNRKNNSNKKGEE